MNALQDMLILPTVLALPRHDGEYTWHTDAYIVQVGCVLRQEQDE